MKGKIDEKNQGYQEYWKSSPQIKKVLVERLQSLNQKNVKAITEDALAEQYYRSWLQIPLGNPMQKLNRHPLLTKADQSKLNQFLQEQKHSQVKYGAMFTTGTLMFYWLFLSRMSRFQRFFNNRQKYRVVNGFKKFFGCYTVYLAWMMILNNHYQKSIPQALNEKGFFKLYGIPFQYKQS